MKKNIMKNDSNPLDGLLFLGYFCLGMFGLLAILIILGEYFR